jgi:SAM-dependent methyltransferase
LKNEPRYLVCCEVSDGALAHLCGFHSAANQEFSLFVTDFERPIMSETNWEELYQSGDTGWDKGAASPGLVDFLRDHPDLTFGSVIVPGCGMGHDVRAWLSAGFAAVGYDVAPSAVQIATEKTQAANLPADFRMGDFLSDEPPTLFDYMFEHTLFCAIQPGRREDYVQAARRWLKPGGELVAVHYLIPDEDGPPFGTTRDEVIERFSPHFELISDWIPRSYPNRTNLEHLLRWRRK